MRRRFSEIKTVQFGARTLYSVLHAVIPIKKSALSGRDKFPLFTHIDLLFNEGVNVPPVEGGIASALPRLVKGVETAKAVIKFETPETLNRTGWISLVRFTAKGEPFFSQNTRMDFKVVNFVLLIVGWIGWSR
ncbi:putative linoleate 13S-lipoxygenase [Helianthus anomalus]